jgi:Zn-dependent protease/CBS domain-containing protein
VESSFKLGRIAGIEIGIHYTWLFAFALISWSLAGGYFPNTHPGWGTGLYWVLGVLAALLLFGSVLVHELSHSFMALARGQGVHGITLFIFGGVSTLKADAEQAGDEFLVAIVGPLTSLGLALLFWLIQRGLGTGETPAEALLQYLAFINFSLGLFNLLPGFPLDGGRVLRAVVWGATGSMTQATRIASFVGQGIGFLMIMVGLFYLLTGQFLSGLWIAFIGWFLNGAAEGTRQQQALREELRGVKVGELMHRQPAVVSPELSVEAFVYDQVLREGRRAVVVADGSRLLGLVSVTDAKQAPRERWADTPVAEVMTPAPLKTVSSSTDLAEALQLLVDGTLNQLPVVDDGLLVGMLSRADLLRFYQLRDSLRLEGFQRHRV